jgi:hypothetical protein
MKVVIGPYRSWIGPYQIAEALCWWVPKKLHEGDILKRKPEWVHDFGHWLATSKTRDDGYSWLYRLCNWIESKRERQIYVRIDKFDSWSADHTLALIAVPLLKQLQATKHGAPNVDDDDVPEGLGLRSYETDKIKASEHDVDANHFKRWDWVLGEIIWALEQKTSDSVEDQFYSKVDPNLKSDDINAIMENTVIDWTAMNAWQARKTRGYKLFGKYYENLWD